MAPGLGWTELGFILLVMLVVIRPERLPGALRTLMRQYGRLRRYLAGVRESLGKELSAIEGSEVVKDLREQAGVGDLAGLKDLKEIKELNDIRRDLSRLAEGTGPSGPGGAPGPSLAKGPGAPKAGVGAAGPPSLPGGGAGLGPGDAGLASIYPDLASGEGPGNDPAGDAPAQDAGDGPGHRPGEA
jgi:Tat protein translocase TatB subunit